MTSRNHTTAADLKFLAAAATYPDQYAQYQRQYRSTQRRLRHAW